MKTDRGISDREVKRTPANRCAGVLNFRSFSSSSNYVTRAPLQPRLRDVPREGCEHVQYARDERPSRDVRPHSVRQLPCGASSHARDARRPSCDEHAPDACLERVP
jgi:hypothetical protein